MTCSCGLEDKIKKRIKELESNVPMAGMGADRENIKRHAKIEELKGLLSEKTRIH